MIGYIYKQSYDGIIEKVTLIGDEQYIKIVCIDCKGTGRYYITENDHQECNVCKTSGVTWVSV